MYLSYIDGIRALAVISVILYHLNPHFMPGGYAGVDVFFVVSGFVVSFSLDRYSDLRFHDFIVLFYVRRIRRIYPALIFCILITIYLSALFIPDCYLSSANNKTALYSFFGLSNIILSSGQSDYFGPITEFNPFMHTWSLGVEEQFYFIFPYIFYLWTINKNRYCRKLSTVIFTVLLATSLFVAFLYSNTNKLCEYYLITSRFWELSFGILTYQLIKYAHSIDFQPFKSVLKCSSFFGLALIFIGILFSNKNSFPFPWALFPVFGTSILIFSVYHLKQDSNYFLTNKAMTTIGKGSYSLYLWHWPIIVLFHWTIGIDGFIHYIMAISLMSIMAYVSYRLVETRLRTSLTISKLPNWSILLSGALLVVASSSFGNTLINTRDKFTLTIGNQKYDWYSHLYRSQDDNIACHPEVKYNGFKGGVKVSIGCPNPSVATSIFILGDSHAGAYNNLLQRYSSKTKGYSNIYTMNGCGDTINKTLEEMSPECVDFIRASIDEIESNAKPGDILLVSALKLYRFVEQWHVFDDSKMKELMRSDKAEEARKKAIEENIKLFSPIAEKGIRIAFEAPKPIFYAPPFRCTKWFNKSNPICRGGLKISKLELLKYRQPVMDALQLITAGIKNSSIFDPFDVLCPNKTCEAVINGKPLFFDGDHLSAYGDGILYDHFLAFTQK